MPLFDVGVQSIPSNLLHDKYGWPPFSILNTKSWDWQRRKDEWEALGIFSGEGRDVKRRNATPVNTFSSRGISAKTPESLSLFDPYLCELMYKWFSTDGMTVLDPFAGGSVRGLVAAVLGRNYTGIDLSEVQIDANRSQYSSLFDSYTNILGTASWTVGDSFSVLKDDQYHNFADLVFTCPPYYNLEVYNRNDARDLSAMHSYSEFLSRYSDILQLSAAALREDSFFVIVVSEVRASSFELDNSYYYGFVPDTIHILRDKCGLQYYNEIILENNIGSLPIRAPKYFDRSRKIGRHHQNILVFYKGHIQNIEAKFGKVIV